MTNLENAIVDNYASKIIVNGEMVCDTPADAVFFLVDYIKEINANEYGQDVNKVAIRNKLTAVVVTAVAKEVRA